MSEDFLQQNIATSWGVVRIRTFGSNIICCSLPFLETQPAIPFSLLNSNEHSGAQHYVRTLLQGQEPAPLPIALPEGTPFQRKVWAGIQSIPWGKTLSYGALAEYIGSPRAARAVANACGKNPLPLFIPCHRVIGARGALGGFSAGLSWKRQLLSLEKSIGH